MAETITTTVRNAAKAVVLHDGRVLLQRAHWVVATCVAIFAGLFVDTSKITQP
ncbi:hypothetical protein E4N62_12895 [Streptomyces sp. MNU76]|uniref:hypothetical protein n=1 Tax=Streptomyces sp. MNU76 TaxID=2560026 RepID=UPI001E5B2653|nr:hypothetical protein [Streptomyces sp. MNU76]MCC9706079.1 hypothetical protein [Streptomyces sp. MNU76]